jgi:predicted permease
MIADLRAALRAAARAPLVTAAAVVTIALGLGATTAIFSVANAVLLRPLPVRDPHRLVTVTSETALQFGFRGGTGWSYQLWEALRQRQAPFDGAFTWTLQAIDLADGGEAQPAQVLFVSGDFFTMLGVDAALGRTFTARDDVRGGGPDGPIAVVGFDAWQRRFDGAADVIGTQVSIGGAPVTIVGVAPRRFFGVDTGQRFDFAVPLGVEPLVRGTQSIVDSPHAFLLRVMLRLRPGQSLAQGQAAMRALHADILRERSGAPRFFEDPVVLVPAATGISDRLRQQYERPLVIVGVIAVAVLVIGCLNLANLLLARTAAARGDLGVRLALGASRWRIARQVVLEGAVLVALGASAGLAGGLWGSRVLASSIPVAAGAVELDLSLDWRVAAFGAAAAVMTLLLCSLLPVLIASRAAPLDVMDRPGARGQTPRVRFAGSLVTVQVAVSAALVLAAAMFVRTAVGLSRVPLGFDAEDVLIVTADTQRLNLAPARQPALFQRLVEVVSSLPGVTHAAGSIWTPLGGGWGLMTDARGRPHVAPDRAAFNFVSPGWFAAYRIPIVAGRDLTAADAAPAPRVALVNETFVRRLLPERPAVGRTTNAGACGDQQCTIVGVVQDARYSASPRDPLPPTIYLPLAQSAGSTPSGRASVRLTLRLAPDAPSPTPAAIASALAAVDPRVTFTVHPLAADVHTSLSQERLLAALAGMFGLLALLLAGLGIYGVTAYGVTRRRRELAIRLALGADRRSIVALVTRQLLIQLVAGTLIGLAVAFWLSRFVTALLFGIGPMAPLTVAAVVLTLLLAGVLAAWAPIRLALRVPPASLLRAGE